MKQNIKLINCWSYNKMEDPYQTKYTKYFCYVDVINFIRNVWDEWLQVNPRDQNDLNKKPFKYIKQTLLNDGSFFFIKNRGLLIFADSTEYHINSKELEITLKDPHINGIVDGGHTFRIIRNFLIDLLYEKSVALKDRFNDSSCYCNIAGNKKDLFNHYIFNINNDLLLEQELETIFNSYGMNRIYVNVEILINLESEKISQVALTRNSSYQVNDVSIDNLKGRFDHLREILKSQRNYLLNSVNNGVLNEEEIIINGKEIEQRLVTKQGSIDTGQLTINVEDIINLLQILTDYKTEGNISYYNSKNAIYTRFMSNLERYEIKHKEQNDSYFSLFENILFTALQLYDKIQIDICNAHKYTKKFYGRKKCSKGKTKKEIFYTKFSKTNMKHAVPDGLVKPILSSFKLLVKTDSTINKYYFYIDPIEKWKELRSDLILLVLKDLEKYKNNAVNQVGKDEDLYNDIYNLLKNSINKNMT